MMPLFIPTLPMQPYDTVPPMMNVSIPLLQLMGSMMMVVVLFVVLELVLKGLALWRAARMNMPGWFVALLIINSAGIFPLVFIIVTGDRYQAVNKSMPKTAAGKKSARK